MARPKRDPMNVLRPYVAAFVARFKTMLQYRAAALAGFTTQCWWGGLKVMVFAAFYRHSTHAHASMTLSQVITYTWVGQALLTLQPWAGFDAWAWRAPADATQAGLFAISLLLMILLGAAFTMLVNLCITATLTDRGINTLAPALVILFSGNLIPLGLFPDWLQPVLIAQPFAGMLDIPTRIYIGALSGGGAWGGLALQVFWTLVFVMLGRKGIDSVMTRLEVQGG